MFISSICYDRVLSVLNETQFLHLNLFEINASAYQLSALHLVRFFYMLLQKEFYVDIFLSTLVLVMRFFQFPIVVEILYLEIFG